MAIQWTVAVTDKHPESIGKGEACCNTWIMTTGLDMHEANSSSALASMCLVFGQPHIEVATHMLAAQCAHVAAFHCGSTLASVRIDSPFAIGAATTRELAPMFARHMRQTYISSTDKSCTC